MMPMAMGFLFLEVTLLPHLFIEDDDQGPAPLAPCPWAWLAAGGPSGSAGQSGNEQHGKCL